MHLLCLFFLLLQLFNQVQCATISFDISKAEDCFEEIGGCAFDSTSIWINNVAPTTNDDVSIISTTTYSSPLLLYLPGGYEMQLSNVLVQGANVLMESGSLLNISVLELGPSSFLSVMDGASLLGVETSNITVSPSASLNINGSVSWYGELQLYGSVVISSNATLDWGNTTFAPVYSSIDALVSSVYFTILHNIETYFPAGLVVYTQLAVAGNASATINSQFMLGDILELQEGRLILATNASINLIKTSAFITCPNGTYGTGNITISDSEVNFVNKYAIATFNGSVSISGDSHVEFQKFNVRNLHLGSSDDSVSVIGNGFAVAAVADGFGTLTIEGAGLNISGRFAIEGSIDASNSQIIIFPNGSLVLSANGDLGIENATILLGGTIQGDIEIPQTSIVNSTYNHVTIYGNVVNNGLLHVAENRVLVIRGNFTQTLSAILRVDLANTNESAINVTDAFATVAGDLQYKLTKKPFLHSAKYPILGGVNSSLSGNFNNNSALAVEHSVVMRELKVVTEGSVIYIVYDFNVRDVEAWEWAVMSVSGLIILAIAITCIVRFRRKRDAYEEIPFPFQKT